jgi:hypothetical protein
VILALLALIRKVPRYRIRKFIIDVNYINSVLLDTELVSRKTTQVNRPYALRCPLLNVENLNFPYIQGAQTFRDFSCQGSELVQSLGARLSAKVTEFLALDTDNLANIAAPLQVSAKTFHRTPVN